LPFAPRALKVEDPSQVAEVRRVARDAAHRAGFAPLRVENIALVVTEMSTNLLKHAGGGYLLLQIMWGPEPVSMQVVALDKGPGIGNIQQCLSDGYTTVGTAGTGLGAIQRLSSRFDIYSAPGAGAAILACVDAEARRSGGAEGGSRVRIGGVQAPKPGEELCGDVWSQVRSPGAAKLLVADGLGHGPDAASAASVAAAAFQANPDAPPQVMVDLIHRALRSTRGAAIAVAEMDICRGVVTFAGLGNVAGVIFSPSQGSRHLLSSNGTAGHEMRNVHSFSYDFPDDGVLVMHSDGLNTRWDLARYPGILSRDTELIAGVLYRDFTRGNDDATAVVMKLVEQ
jgi:anti-sigma regulatory factor (Ser/Thr protein kinase)